MSPYISKIFYLEDVQFKEPVRNLSVLVRHAKSMALFKEYSNYYRFSLAYSGYYCMQVALAPGTNVVPCYLDNLQLSLRALPYS